MREERLDENIIKSYIYGEWPLLKDGEPCHHRGCLSHISHPCEGCGRVGGSTQLTRAYYEAR